MAEKFPLMTYVTGILARLNANSRKPTAYLYNGIRLPALPEWDREKYPYAAILSTDDGTIIDLYAVDNPLYVYKNTGTYAMAHPTSYTRWSLYDGNIEEWGYKHESSTLIGGVSLGFGKYIWSNYDYKYDDGTVFALATVPVPVYE